MADTRDDPSLADYNFGVNPEVDAIRNDFGLDDDTRKLADQIAQVQQNIAQVGLNPQEAEPRESLFMRGLNALSYPLHGALGVMDAIVSGDIGSADVGTGWQRGEDENLTGSEYLRKHHVLSDSPIARGLAGFGIDMIADPVTWLSLGTGSVAKVGGKALTEAGAALHATGVSRLAALGVTDTIEQSKMLEEAFRAMDIAKDATSQIEKYRKAGASADAIAAESSRFASAEDVYSSVFKSDEVLGNDIFAKPTLNIGKDLPFLGHLTGEAIAPSAEVLNDAGPIGKALRTAGYIFSPGHLDVAKIELPDNLLNAFSNIRNFANAQLANTGAALAKIPLVGEPTVALAKGFGNAYDALSSEMARIFNQKALIGEGSANAREEFLNLKAAAPSMAMDRTVNILGAENLTKTDKLKDAYLLIDSLAKDATLKGPLDKEKTFNLLKKMSYGQEASDGDLAELRNVFQTPLDAQGLTPELYFRSGLQTALQSPDLDPEVKDIAQRIVNGMDQLSLQEAEKGIDHGFLEYYVTHKYLDPERNPFSYASGASDAKFTKARSYDTIADAFNQGGKIADTDVANLLKWRIQKSITLQGQVDFAHRLAIEHGVPQQLVTSLYKEAALDPGGIAAQALRRYHFEPPTLDWDGIKDTAISAERQKMYQKALGGDPEAQKLMTKNLAEFQDYVHSELWKNGQPPFDKGMPMGLLGEIGDTIKSPDGKEIFLPKAVADAYKETVASRDYFKEAMGGSAIGRTLVRAMDATTNMMRKWVTMPFPAFWARHFTTGRFRQAMQGLEAMNPGVMARTYSLLKGESAIRNKAGQLLDTPTLNRLLSTNNLKYGVSDYIGVLGAHADSDIDAYLRTGKGMLDNLFSSAPGAKKALLTQVHDKFERGFDGFFRVNHIVHRFEQGDSLGDAVKAANDTYFNYTNMSNVERSWFRRFYMFYGFMSNATKSTMNDLITKPGNIMLQLHGTRALAEFLSDEDAAPTAEAHDYRLLNASLTGDRLSYQIGETEDGKALTASGFGTPLEHVTGAFTAYAPRNFSVGELASTAVDSVKRTLQKQFASSNPVINSVAQAVSGKNLYFDKPLSADFLRKLPDLTEAAEKIAGYTHTSIPTTINDAAKEFLDAVPDGKGRLIVNPAKMWILVNLVPGFARSASMAGTFSNADIPTKAALIRAMTGVNVNESEVSRSYLYDQKNELEKYYASHDIKKRLELLKNGGVSE